MPHTASRRPGRPPASEAGNTREHILHAAREVFTELGYDAATFQTIAARADLTRPAVNHYFANKQVLYEAVLEDTKAMAMALRGSGASSTPGAERNATLSERMHTLIKVATGAEGPDRSVAAFLMTSVLESHRHPDLGQSDNGALTLTRRFASAAVHDAIASGELRADLDVDATVEMLVTMVCGIGFYASFIGDHDQICAVTKQFLELLNGKAWGAEKNELQECETSKI